MKVEKEIHLLMAHRDKRDTIKKILAEYNLPMLVKIAAKLYDVIFNRYHYPKYDMEKMLTYVLWERRKRLDTDFKWTDENKARLLFISDRLYEACVKGWQEATETAAALEERIKRKDSFLNDYEIKITLNVYPKIGGEREAAEAVAEHLGEETLRSLKLCISHCHYDNFIKNEDYKTDITINKSINWNSEYFNGEFDNDYISYAIHDMLDTHVWSFADILSIRDIWVNVEVTHQYNTRIPKEKD